MYVYGLRQGVQNFTKTGTSTLTTFFLFSNLINFQNLYTKIICTVQIYECIKSFLFENILKLIWDLKMKFWKNVLYNIFENSDKLIHTYWIILIIFINFLRFFELFKSKWLIFYFEYFFVSKFQNILIFLQFSYSHEFEQLNFLKY